MKKLDFRNMVTAFVGAVMNRSILLMMNPFGIAYFACAYMYRPGRLLLTGASVIGMATAMPIGILLKYIGVILGILVIVKVLELKKKTVTPLKMALICGILISIAGFAYSAGLNGLEQTGIWQLILISSLEGIAAFSMVFVFNYAVRVFLFHKNENTLSNEEQISLGITMALGVFAFRNFLMNTHSVFETLILFVILYIGYCYGAGGGAIAGACIGSVMAYQQSDVSLPGFMAMLGILAGAFREKGRLASGLTFMAGVIITGYLGIPWMLDISSLEGMAAAVLVFVLLPDGLISSRKMAANKENKEADSIQKLTRNRLRDFSDSFRKLAGTFNAGVAPRSCLSQEEVDEAFDELTRNVCAQCSRCDYCWEKEYDETYNAASNILDYFSKNGDMKRSELPLSFKKRCINIDRFLNETSRVMEVAKLNLNWRNRMMESRLAIAGQMGEVAEIIDDFSQELDEDTVVDQPEAAALRQRLSMSKVNVKSLTVVKKPNNRRIIYMVAKMRRGRCMTAKEISSVIKEVFGKEFILAKGCRMVISKEFNTYEFVEDVRLKTVQGVAQAIKTQENVSGDSYTFLPLPDGQMILSLSDGMGSGKMANEDSEYIIQLLEQLLDTGFGKQSAVRLINSLMFLKSDQKAFSTIDMSILDLYSGICEFIKIGASTTYIKHKTGVEAIRSETLPVGAFTQVDYEGDSKQMEDGDMIIMLTDGIINHIDSENKEDVLAQYIDQLDTSSPQETANAILKYAMAGNKYVINDDMTVLTCGIYKT
ncbi:MAG TPA: stage II sporulation protein E [Candidatus Scybalocola faecavium]|nr:stage II sporulation protein E [Candidatus Scybalocola faecavium]